MDDQVKGLTYQTKIPFGRDMYETWYKIEKSIMKFDRMFNKVEKFDARSMTDPLNHERREKRMLDKKRERWTKNYTYFFGELTEEEQMYRDYFQSEVELDIEDDYVDEKFDDIHLAAMGQFDPALYDFVDYTQSHDAHESYEDIVEDKIFKFKYRQFADDRLTYQRRNIRMIDRFLERAKTRDPVLEQNLTDLFESDARDNSIAQMMVDPSRFRDVATEETRPFREYMVNESIQQYKDYYESDDEESGFFEYLENFTNRDKIRFMELFEDHTVDKLDQKHYISIEKREYNPELSVFSNMVLDLVDFKDRVRPLSRDISQIEYAMKHQKQNVEQMLAEREDFKQMLAEVQDDKDKIEAGQEGYSSMEIPEPKAEEPEAVDEEKKEN